LRPLTVAAKAELPPVLRGIVFQLIEHLGALPRRRLEDQIRGLTAEERAVLAALGVRFGRETVWIGGLNDKRQRKMLSLLLAVSRGEDLSVSKDQAPDEALLLARGQRSIGGKLFEFGALENVAADLRRRSKAGPLVADAETAAALKLDVAVLEAVMRALGYHSHGAKPSEESTPRKFTKPRRRRETPPPTQLNSPFAALASITFKRR
jgi:ATP-dependent RNA helicase SUPV3L1/SUV3